MTNSKSKINLNFQAQMTETILSEILNFGHWSLSGIWCLVFGAWYLVLGLTSEIVLLV